MSNTKPKLTNLIIHITLKKPNDLKNTPMLMETLKSISTLLEYKILKRTQHIFDNKGMTGILLLAESHIAIHTWPENNYAFIELISCKNITQDSLKKVESFLLSKFNIKNLKIKSFIC